MHSLQLFFFLAFAWRSLSLVTPLVTPLSLDESDDMLTNTLDIIVRSGSDSGPNIASDSPVFHTSTSSSSTSEKHKQKRAVSRPVNQCAAGQTFDYSLCIPQTSAQAYVLVCSYDDEDGTPNYIQSYLACEPYEICVEEESDGLAFCVSEVNFKLIQQAQTGGVTSAYYASHILTPSQQQQLGQTGVVATLVDLDNTTSVFAQRILLEAEGSLSTAHAGGTISFDTLVLADGTDDCTNCNSVGFNPIPKGTISISLAIWLPAAVTAAQLYIATYTD
ncbi:hypothetical protein MMC08_004892 [Hypocenomyce scalaris]|nr:hypothetical protein [Hypocenomyce scalaris]